MKKRYVVAGILAAAGLICGGIAYYQYYQDAHAGQEYEKIKEKVVTEEPKKPEETQKSTVEIPIDFQTLQNMNPDIYAWIKVPGTVIDYPIVQSGTDNSYYLNHSVEHDENKAGAIFTEDYNTKTFEDPNTVIYGHGMANGSMFDGLHQYMDRDFFDQNKEVIIYMPDKILHYQIFAAYLYDNRHLLQSFNFDNKDIYQASHHLYLTRIPGISDETRREIIIKLAERGVNTNVHYKPLPMMTAYKTMGWDIKDFPNAYAYYENLITLPLHTKLSDEDVEYVIENYKEVVGEYIS